MNCCICGAVKNCGKYLDKVFENIEKIGNVFDDYKIILFYDKSDDNTLDKLKKYQEKNNRLFFFINKNIQSAFRTHNIAIARNYCLNYVRQNNEYFPFFIMMDMDDVNCKDVNVNILKKYLDRNDWDALSFNSSPKYYDIWGLSIYPYCFSYNHFKNNVQNYYVIQDYIMNKLKNLKPDQILQCRSSFNGFSIYRTKIFIDSYYDGRVRLDLLTVDDLLTHAKAASSKLVFKDYGHVKGHFEDCEHRAFHFMAIKKHNARIMISPEILFS
jgi:hypothetical protein